MKRRPIYATLLATATLTRMDPNVRAASMANATERGVDRSIRKPWSATILHNLPSKYGTHGKQ